MYDANFTAGGLLFNEFISLKNILANPEFDALVMVEEQENNLMAVSMLTSRKRILTEIKRRREKAPIDFWDHFYSWSEKEQKLALFYLCLKSYPLVLDIHLDLSMNKFKVGANLSDYDVKMWLDNLSTRNEKVASWSEKTHYKINVQYRKMLKDAGLLNDEHLTSPISISNSFRDYFSAVKELWFLESCFLK